MHRFLGSPALPWDLRQSMCATFFEKIDSQFRVLMMFQTQRRNPFCNRTSFRHHHAPIFTI
ncbi:hypothetical protein MA16_Dca008205 [Dendrobium catenatum]|uniref:Uncharacterized protein n=1 Tax=Dendrobium catenatum TaxID=906689 RepID=A0A2I0XA57_9ASPA|nr:hypothetical protein MA16_Dca008205 [Dendrobium catenatum]